MSRHDLTQERLKELLHYDESTGVISKASRIGIPLGSVNKKGYRRISVAGHAYAAHRLAWLYMTGEWPASEMDHINRLPDDNRWSNLRLASTIDNQANRAPWQRAKVKAKGVIVEPWGGYRARLYRDNKTYHGGYHRTVDEAAHAYNKLAIEHFGEFAVLNPIGEDKHVV